MTERYGEGRYGTVDETTTPAPRFGDATYGSTTYEGPTEPVQATTQAPWRWNRMRIDGVTTMPPPVPGESASVTCVVFDAQGVDSAADRYQTLRRYLEYAPWTSVMPAQGTCYYREAHDGPDGSQLVELAPLERDATGREEPPEQRSSIDEARWCVVTGGDDSFVPAEYPSPVYQVDLELTTIAPSREFGFVDETFSERRQTVRDAYERNGLGL